jgi:PAS domain S-box-containing protein
VRAIGLSSGVVDFADSAQAEEDLRRSEERFDLAARGTNDGLWVRDIKRDTEWWSSRFYQLLGYDDHEFQPSHQAFLSLLHPDDKERTVAALRDHLRHKVPYDIEYRLRTKSGEYRWFSARGQAVCSADVTVRMAGSIRDITDQRLAAEELHRSNAELEQFAHVVSHDLQEPLRAVNGYCSLLDLHCKDKLDERALGYIQNAVEGANRMQVLLQELLDYSRINHDERHSTEVRWDVVRDRVESNLSRAIEESGATLNWSALPTIIGFESQMARLLQNLIGNAIKYRTDRPPVVDVTAERFQDQWRFSVFDNGIGIDPQHADRIFDKFQRLHTHAEYPGSGIGLSICKRIVERHGGQIWIEPSQRQGTTVYFTIPREASG